MAGPHHDPDGEDNGECRLLGPFSILVQAALGSLALLSLVYKRWVKDERLETHEEGGDDEVSRAGAEAGDGALTPTSHFYATLHMVYILVASLRICGALVSFKPPRVTNSAVPKCRKRLRL